MYKNVIEKIKTINNGFSELSRVLDITPECLRDKLEGKSPLYLHEVEMICDSLGIEKGEEKLNFFKANIPFLG